MNKYVLAFISTIFNLKGQGLNPTHHFLIMKHVSNNPIVVVKLIYKKRSPLRNLIFPQTARNSKNCVKKFFFTNLD